MQTNPVHWAE